jgi:hypothetical protein
MLLPERRDRGFETVPGPNPRSSDESAEMPLNECCASGEDFASLAALDAHILSK